MLGPSPPGESSKQVCWGEDDRPNVLSLQVRSADPSGGLCGVSDAFPAHRGGDEASTAVREGQETSGGSER